MAMEDKDNPEEASKLFLQAWDEATDNFEKFIAAFYVARHQKDVPGKLKWYEMALQLALSINNDAVKAAFAPLYLDIAKCYEDLGELDKAKWNYDLAISCTEKPSDKGPFYHGTKAVLQVGDMFTAGRESNYKADLVMNHIYFTALANGAGLAAELAKGEGQGRVYMVEPTGEFENDPNVTNKKFPGNPTRSYRTDAPLKVIGEVKDWARQTSEELQKWREKLDNNKREIIN
jgi:rifampin ADP-ribosylating transferase